MFRPGCRLIYLGTLFLGVFAVQLYAQNAVPLPVKKVELYKNGMGYFEHLGTVEDSQNVEIVLPSNRLNDVLKSLTVLDLNGGRITGVNYDSAAPLDRRLAELPFNLASKPGLVDFLNSIRGAGIQVKTSKDTLSGKLVGAELRSRAVGPGTTTNVIQVTLFTDEGEIRLVELESIGAFKLTDPELANDFGRYLDLLNTTHQRDVRHLRIGTDGKGRRQIFIGYTSESPIWKTTYRIVLDPDQKPLLQGWAIVDNTTPMDWKDVSLSLVAGAPISFIQDLSQPIYARRPVVPLPQGVQVQPQLSEATIETEMPSFEPKDEMKAQARSDLLGAMREEGMPRRALTEAFAAAPPPQPAMPSSVSDAMRQQIMETAQARAVADQFEYRIGQPVTILRNESALLPVLQSEIDGEKVSIFKDDGNEAHPRLAFWLENTSGLTLDAGAITLIDSNAFAGEGLIETVQPGENRLFSYALDLGSEISTKLGSERQRVERVVINRGTMHMHSKMVEKKTYRIRNNNEKARTFVLEYPVRYGWKLLEPTPVESSANFYRFKVPVKPKSTAEFVVREESPIDSSFSVASITPEQISVWTRDRSIDPEIEKALRGIVAKKNEISGLARELASLEKEQKDIFEDQDRIRSNIQRLSRTPEENALRQRYLDKLNDQETRLAVIQDEQDTLEASRAKAQAQLDELIQDLSIDKNLN
jgi:hypothetical protein